jgi:sulfoxide reductase heme-binding subunit YedZ
MNLPQNHFDAWGALRKPIGTILLVGLIFAGMLIAIVLGQSLGGTSFAQRLGSLFALNSTQIWWYVTRASGLTGYFLLWLSMVWGFAIPTGLARPLLENVFSYDFHEHLSLLGLGFVMVHVGVLLFDKYLPFNIIQLLIPFIDPYRPFWVGLGIISFYILFVVTFTFYLRQKIGAKLFRSIHVLSLVSYLGTTLHGLFAGTDSALPMTMVLYAGTFLVVIFLTVYWLILRTWDKNEKEHVTVTQIGRKATSGRRR